MKKGAFKDLFEVDESSGAWLYKTDACCDRHTYYDRDDMNKTRMEDWRAQGYFGNSAYFSELRNLGMAHDLIANNAMRPKDEPLEEWIAIWKDKLGYIDW